MFFYRAIPIADSAAVAAAFRPSLSAGLSAGLSEYFSFTNELPLAKVLPWQAALYFIATRILDTQHFGLKSGRQVVKN